MKALLSPKYIYKLPSKYIHDGKYKPSMSMEEGIERNFVISISNSQAIRFLWELNNDKENKSEEKIREIKDNIKHLNKQKNNAKNRTLMKEYNDKLNYAKLEEGLCSVEFSSEKHYDKMAKDGFYFNGSKYSLLLGTPGGIKLNCALFVKEDIKQPLLKKLWCNFDNSVPFMPSKLMGYMALAFSGSNPVTWTDRVLVVKDVETHFKDTVNKIKFNDELDRPDIVYTPNADITVNACDGCGMIIPELADIWSNDLQLGYECVAFCIRNAWTKGMLTRFDFRTYCKEVLKVTMVQDVWGEWHNIDDIDIILNESMLKCWKGYTSISQYLNSCKEYGYEFAATKAVPKVQDKMRTLNYQYLQCLNLSDKDIEDLVMKDVNEIKEVLGLDYRKTILYGKGLDLNDDNVWNEKITEDRFIKALMINKDCINDPYIRSRLRKLINKRIKQLKTGKIKVQGNYQLLIGEPVIQLESMCGFEPKGLLNRGEFFIEYWRRLGYEEVACFRSPMSCKSNARVMEVCHRDEVIRWYGDLEGLIIFNAWDTTMSALNGADFDGDLGFTTPNEILLKGIFRDEPTLDCEGKSANKIPFVTEEHFIKCIKDSFGNAVGRVTNVGSSCYDKISLFTEGSEEYKELDYRIKCVQYYQQECIDSAKNGVPPKPIPSYWNNPRSEMIRITNEDEGELLETKEFYNRTLVDKKPYYFRYIYEDTNNQYTSFLSRTNDKCYSTFGVSYNELLSQDTFTEEELEFIKYSERKNPISDNPCIVNKIAHIVEGCFDVSYGNTKTPDFDYTIYQEKDNNKAASKTIQDHIVILCEEYNQFRRDKKFNSGFFINKETILNDIEISNSLIINKLREMIPNNQVLLNTLLLLSYKKGKISKWLVWECCGNTLIENALNNVNRIISYPSRDENGDIDYSGYKFSMKDKIIGEEKLCI